MSKSLFKFLLLAGFSAFILTGCKDEVYGVVEENAKCMQDESLKGYLKTISRKAPAYKTLKATLPQVFESFDMEYKIVSIQVIDKKEKKIEIKEEKKEKEGEEGGEKKEGGGHGGHAAPAGAAPAVMPSADGSFKIASEGEKKKEGGGEGGTDAALMGPDEEPGAETVEFGATPKPTPTPITRLGVARVKVVQITKKKKGTPNFADNKMSIIHELILEDNVWKIYKSERDGVTYY